MLKNLAVDTNEAMWLSLEVVERLQPELTPKKVRKHFGSVLYQDADTSRYDTHVNTTHKRLTHIYLLRKKQTKAPVKYDRYQKKFDDAYEKYYHTDHTRFMDTVTAFHASTLDRHSKASLADQEQQCEPKSN